MSAMKKPTAILYCLAFLVLLAVATAQNPDPETDVVKTNGTDRGGRSEY
jgi:hypothetical protein